MTAQTREPEVIEALRRLYLDDSDALYDSYDVQFANASEILAAYDAVVAERDAAVRERDSETVYLNKWRGLYHRALDDQNILRARLAECEREIRVLQDAVRTYVPIIENNTHHISDCGYFKRFDSRDCECGTQPAMVAAIALRATLAHANAPTTAQGE